MKKKWLVIVLALLLCFNAYLILVKKSNEEKFARSMLQEKTKTINLENKVKDNNTYIKSLYSNYIPKRYKNVVLQSFKNTDLLKSKKIVFFHDKHACGSCIEETLFNLKVLGRTIGFDNIIIANNIRKDNIGRNENGFHHLYMETFHLEVEELNEPMVFIVDEDLNIDLLYLPQLYPDFKEEYFTELLPKYFNNFN